MKRLALIALLGVALLGPAEAAPAKRHFVPCWRASGLGVAAMVKPRSCTMGGQYGYQQATIRKIRWRGWGGSTTYGRGTLLDNMGFRAPVRFKLYRRQLFGVAPEFGFYVYRRARGTTYPKGEAPLRWRLKLSVRALSDDASATAVRRVVSTQCCRRRQRRLGACSRSCPPTPMLWRRAGVHGRTPPPLQRRTPDG
jgi:hypothetical protein